ncbi:DUF401 family protein [Kiritimatiella glycovorans]|uniref:Integral membrane protein n=1 Tax=Kiritimatiella glycovorans TaxID=1307763 RepID=A0A0G3EHX0_9BACT|nr:DUF401 family protein [Kiritimatiella glycovorans]AKJ64400.1 integral membrane protein [Kiritimatiella glycovorans]
MPFGSTLIILGVFAAVLAATRAGLSLGAALAAGGVALALLAGRGTRVPLDFAGTFALPELWLLLAITVLITEFGRIMTEPHNAESLMALTRKWGGREVGVMIAPAAIGLVPMPGGALFSAPLVGQTASEDHWTPEWKSAVNYWFRHVWEYWWPLYPVIMVTLSVTSVEYWRFFLLQAPFTLVSFGAGYLFLVRPHRGQLNAPVPGLAANTQRAVFLLLMLGLVMAGALLIPELLQAVLPAGDTGAVQMTGVLIALAAVGVPVVLREPRESRRRLFAQLRTRKARGILGTLTGVLIFKHMLSVSGLLPRAAEEMMTGGVPALVVSAALPFIAGLVTGIAVGFAGTAFPLVIGLYGGSDSFPLPVLALAFAFGYAGMMLSPMHLCFVLTRNHFEARFHRIYRYLWPCVASVIATGLVLYFVAGGGG